MKISLIYFSFFMLFSCTNSLKVYHEDKLLKEIDIPQSQTMQKFEFHDWTIHYKNKNGEFDGIINCKTGNMGMFHSKNPEIMLNSNGTFSVKSSLIPF
jgi:hypothetical protein